MVEKEKKETKHRVKVKKLRESAVPIDQLSLLPDPIGDRVMKDVPVLCNRPMDDSDLWPTTGKPNYKLLQEHMLREGPVTKK
jgi:hypothetical protein